MTPSLKRALAEFGTELDMRMIEGTYALMAPLAPSLPDPAYVRRDLAYGSHPRHRLDLFKPQGTPRAVLVYIHGGGFVVGDKGAPTEPFFNNFGAWAMASGMIGVTLNYRLVPDAKWPDGGQDVADAVVWLRREAATFGGDPDRIMLVGQSAGAIHVADAIRIMDADGAAPVACAAMLSGIYDLVEHDRMFFEDAYYGVDQTMWGNHSTLDALLNAKTPCLFTLSEHDPAPFHRQVAVIVRKSVDRNGVWPRVHYLAGHNHMSPPYSIGMADDDIGPLLLDFLSAALPDDGNEAQTG